MLLTLIATLAVFLATAAVGAMARARVQRPAARRAALAAGLLLALPCVVFAIYYLHWWHEPLLLYRFRALPGSELAAGLSGLLAGWCAHRLGGDRRRMVRLAIPLLMVFPLLLVVPYLKPLLSPLDLDRLKDRWQDGVCLQSTGSTCGPSSVATLIKAVTGRTLGERAIAQSAHTTVSGSECWYLVRVMRAEGLVVSMSETAPNPPRLPWPAIAGTRLGRDGAGHFVTVLGEGTRGGWLIGDPLHGPRDLDPAELRRAYWFTGFFITVDGQPR